MQICSENSDAAGAVADLFSGHKFSVTDCETHTVRAQSVDVQHTEGVIKFNSFEADMLQRSKESVTAALSSSAKTVISKQDDATPNPTVSKAVWKDASMFNHSCLSNCNWFTIGDFMVVLAEQDIKEGEELTVSYIDSLSSYAKRQDNCRSLGFCCKCERCLREARTSREIQPLLDELASIKGHLPLKMSEHILISRLESLAARFEKIIPPPSVDVWQTLILLSNVCQANKAKLKAAETLAQALKSLCSPGSDSIVPVISSPELPMLAFTAARFFYNLRRISDGNLWRAVGKDCALQFFCKNEELIKYFYSEIEIVREMTDFFD